MCQWASSADVVFLSRSFMLESWGGSGESMDWPFAGSLVLLGASVGTSWNSVQRAPLSPCVCHCECTSEDRPVQSWALSNWIIISLSLIILVLSGFCWWRLSTGAAFESKGKGKGKRGILGGQAALTLT